MTVASPRRFRVPKIPCTGPPRAILPWMPRNEIGMSSRMPLRISRARETPSSIRSTSPVARTVCSVSRTWATATAKNAIDARASHPRMLRPRSVDQMLLASARQRKSSRVDGRSRGHEISSRRTSNIAPPMRHRPATTLIAPVCPRSRRIAGSANTAPIAVSVNARAISAEYRSARSGPRGAEGESDSGVLMPWAPAGCAAVPVAGRDAPGPAPAR